MEEVSLTSTLISAQPQTPKPTNTIRDIQRRKIRHQHTRAQQRDLRVQIMIQHVHPAFRLIPADARRPLHRARKTLVGGIEGRFPELGELVEDVGDFGLVGVVVEEDDDAPAGQDHFG